MKRKFLYVSFILNKGLKLNSKLHLSRKNLDDKTFKECQKLVQILDLNYWLCVYIVVDRKKSTICPQEK